MNFSKTLSLSFFLAAFSFLGTVSAGYSPIEIKDVRRYAANIEVTVENLRLSDDEQYYLYCEERIPNRFGFSYRSSDKRWQLKAQPTHLKYKYADSILLSVNGVKEDREYRCKVSIFVEGPHGEQYMARTSTVFVRTLKNEVRNYKIEKKGIQADYLDRKRQTITRFVTPKPTKIVFRPRNYFNTIAWGPEYYMTSFFRQK